MASQNLSLYIDTTSGGNKIVDEHKSDEEMSVGRNLPVTSPTGENPNTPMFPADRTRRAKIYENCFGADPVVEESKDSNFKMAVKRNASLLSAVAMLSSFNDASHAQLEEEMLKGIGGQSKLFSYPETPIVKKQLQKDEVESEKRKRTKSTTSLPPADDAIFNYEDDESQERPSYHRIHLQGESASAGVFNLFLYKDFNVLAKSSIFPPSEKLL